MDALHPDILPLIEQLGREGLLRDGAQAKLGSVARRIRTEGRREGSVWQGAVK